MQEIFVGGLPITKSQDDIKAIFECIGPITLIRMPKGSGGALNRGFCFVKFENAAQATEAIEKFNGTLVDGRKIGVKVSQGEKRGLFIAQLDKNWTEQEFTRMMNSVVPGIEKIDLPKAPNQNHRGFAVVTFDTSDRAKAAFEQLRASPFLGGVQIHIEWETAPPTEEVHDKTIYIQNIPLQATEEDIRAAFERFGPIENVRMANEHPDKKPQRNNYGFVNFASPEAVQQALAASSEVTICGEPVNFQISKQKKQRVKKPQRSQRGPGMEPRHPYHAQHRQRNEYQAPLRGPPPQYHRHSHYPEERYPPQYPAYEQQPPRYSPYHQPAPTSAPSASVPPSYHYPPQRYGAPPAGGASYRGAPEDRYRSSAPVAPTSTYPHHAGNPPVGLKREEPAYAVSAYEEPRRYETPRVERHYDAPAAQPNPQVAREYREARGYDTAPTAAATEYSDYRRASYPPTESHYPPTAAVATSEAPRSPYQQPQYADPYAAGAIPAYRTEAAAERAEYAAQPAARYY
eukprot:TRINITY_DN11124_c0_g1_i1.p1 TRINITY_DN11124_c0_g1~~TRINITY_DN11124_c0_g1_i1.p1  ORF type:complete len:516 (+),score=175.06 TRINITY_DN11124_c0_g1_i1:150-1697(+)